MPCAKPICVLVGPGMHWPSMNSSVKTRSLHQCSLSTKSLWNWIFFERSASERVGAFEQSAVELDTHHADVRRRSSERRPAEYEPVVDELTPGRFDNVVDRLVVCVFDRSCPLHVFLHRLIARPAALPKGVYLLNDCHGANRGQITPTFEVLLKLQHGILTAFIMHDDGAKRLYWTARRRPKGFVFQIYAEN